MPEEEMRGKGKSWGVEGMGGGELGNESRRREHGGGNREHGGGDRGTR